MTSPPGASLQDSLLTFRSYLNVITSKMPFRTTVSKVALHPVLPNHATWFSSHSNEQQLKLKYWATDVTRISLPAYLVFSTPRSTKGAMSV